MRGICETGWIQLFVSIELTVYVMDVTEFGIFNVVTALRFIVSDQVTNF